ncbi:MAG: hemolysin family protein [Bacteroidota bacterium]
MAFCRKDGTTKKSLEPTIHMVTDIIITVLLVLLNAFFVAAEFAIVKVRLPQIQALTDKSLAARISEKIINNSDRYLTATQLGITLSSIALGWIGKTIIEKGLLTYLSNGNFNLKEPAVDAIAFVLAFSFVVILHFVFGELIPRALAIRHPVNTTMVMALPLRGFYLLFRPLNWFLDGLANTFSRMFGLHLNQEEAVHTEEELKMIIAESAEGGAIEASERELIQNVFDFDDRFVWQIFQPRAQVAAIEKETPLEEAIEFALAEGYSRFPVYDDSIDNILGFVHTKDLLMLSRQKEKKKKLIKDIIRPVQYVSSNKKVIQLLRQFQKEHEQLAIVVNEFGGTVGLVTLEDIIEELVGEIQDEYDSETPIVETVNDTTYRILAQNPLDEINDMIPEPFPEGEEYHTLSGLLLKLSEEIPEEGNVIHAGDYDVKIIRMLQASPELVEAVYRENSKEEDE